MKTDKKVEWPVVAARIPPELRDKLLLKHSGKGEVTRVIHCLIDKYLQGKIFISIPQSTSK